MSVTVLDLTGKDATAAVAEIQKVVEAAHARGEAVTAMSPLPGGGSLVVVTSPLRSGGAAEELEGFKRLMDSHAINGFDFDEAKKRLIARL